MTAAAQPEAAVDIGLPAYRRPEFISEAISSVLGQTYARWRLVVSENGPGNGEVEAAVRKFTDDPRITYTATGRNIGAPPNWSRLIGLGSAPYFTLIQDDDIWDPGFLARRVEFLERHPGCGFVFSGERKIDRDGRAIAAERTPTLPATDVSEVLPEGTFTARELITAMYRHRLGGVHTPSIASVGVMSRRSALEAVGPYFDDTHEFLYWDVELYLRMALRYETGFLAVRDVAQRVHHPSITTDMPFDGERWVRYHDYHDAWFQRELPDLDLSRDLDELRAQAYVLAALDALEQTDRRRAATNLARSIRTDWHSLLNPRVPAVALALLGGRRGAEALARKRSARRERNDVVAYESAPTGGA
jgi:GT2 family glycosyltransferase